WPIRPRRRWSGSRLLQTGKDRKHSRHGSRDDLQREVSTEISCRLFFARDDPGRRPLWPSQCESNPASKVFPSSTAALPSETSESPPARNQDTSRAVDRISAAACHRTRRNPNRCQLFLPHASNTELH